MNILNINKETCAVWECPENYILNESALNFTQPSD